MANFDSDGSDDLDWESEDDAGTGALSTFCNGEASSSAGRSNSQLISHFVGMNFSRDAIAKAIEENGERNYEAILDSLLNQPASSSTSPSNSQMVSHFVGMNFSRDAIAKAIEENGEKNSEAILDSLLNHHASSSAGPSNFQSVSHFVGMNFLRDAVSKAIDENGDGNSEVILDSLLNLAASSLSGPSNSELVSQTNFLREAVAKAIEENGEGNSEAILDSLLNQAVFEEFSPESERVRSDLLSPETADNHQYKLSDSDSDWASEEKEESISEKDKTLKILVNMGYPLDEATIALARCGPNASILEVTDFICAAQMARSADALFNEDHELEQNKKRKHFEEDERWKKKKFERIIDEDNDKTHLPNPMVGFSLPDTRLVVRRTLPKEATGPPYFYFENVALAPKGEWNSISSNLYDIEPEFVDSAFFSAAARKRGYIHNLPIDNRFPLKPIPPQTIHEAFPSTKRWWPSWDKRTKLNCLLTVTASAKLTERVRKALHGWEVIDPPMQVKKYVLTECKKWNLVWVGKNKAAPLEPDEMEMLLGFPKNHTRGGGMSRTERLRALGNSFQVDTVAYHLSVLKDKFPNGISVLSLFSGIGGAEVALDRLGIPLKNVVAIEISEASRSVFRSWWEQSNQKGNLIDNICDVKKLDRNRLEQLIHSFGCFDLIIGGSPCNNLSGSNRHHRDGLQGDHSILFFEYVRILNTVKAIMAQRS